MFNRHLKRSHSSLLIKHRLTAFFLGLILFIGSHLLMHPSALSQTSPDSPRFADTPERWMVALFEEAPASVDTSYDFIARSEGYAVIPYLWGEGGGFVVLENGQEGWFNICGSGGALGGGDFFVTFCGMNLTDAQTLWEAYRTEYNAAYGEEM